MMNEQKLRTIIRQVISETNHSRGRRVLSEEGSALYKAFVEPFVDVAKSVELAGKDILNTMKLAFDTLTTISPKKLREAREKYEDRRDKIDREWEPLMKKARESVTGDVAIIAMTFAPSVFFGLQASKFTKSATTGVVDALEETGWRIPILSALATSGKGGNKDLELRFENWLDDQEKSRDRAQDTAGRSTLAGQLRVFFFGEAAALSGNILSEAEEPTGTDATTPSKNSGIKQQLDELVKEFLEPALAPARDALMAAKKEQIEDLVGTANTVIRGLRGLAESSKPEDFSTALATLESELQSRGDKGTVDLSPIRDSIEKLKTEMSKKRDEIKRQQGPAPEGSQPEDIDVVAKKASEDAFQQAAGELRKMAAETAQKAIVSYRETIAKELTSDIPTKGEVAKAMISSSTGKEILSMIKKAVDSIGQ